MQIASQIGDINNNPGILNLPSSFQLLNPSWMPVECGCPVLSRLTQVVPRNLHFNKLASRFESALMLETDSYHQHTGSASGFG